jgi:hypothetical protein
MKRREMKNLGNQEENIKTLVNNKDPAPERNEKRNYSLHELLEDLRMEQQETA